MEPCGLRDKGLHAALEACLLRHEPPGLLRHYATSGASPSCLLWLKHSCSLTSASPSSRLGLERGTSSELRRWRRSVEERVRGLALRREGGRRWSLLIGLLRRLLTDKASLLGVEGLLVPCLLRLLVPLLPVGIHRGKDKGTGSVGRDGKGGRGSRSNRRRADEMGGDGRERRKHLGCVGRRALGDGSPIKVTEPGAPG